MAATLPVNSFEQAADPEDEFGDPSGAMHQELWATRLKHVQALPIALLEGMGAEAGVVHKRHQQLALSKSTNDFKSWIQEHSTPKTIGALYKWTAKATPTPQLPEESWCSVKLMHCYTPLQLAAKRSEFWKGYWCRPAKLQQVERALTLARKVAQEVAEFDPLPVITAEETRRAFRSFKQSAAMASDKWNTSDFRALPPRHSLPWQLYSTWWSGAFFGHSGCC